MCSIHFVRADARPKFASNIIIIANVINLILDLVFMGPLKMGVAGSSIATMTGYAVGFVIMSTHFIQKKSTLHFDFSIMKDVNGFFSSLGKMVTMGLSGALGTMLITVKMFFLNTLIQSTGGSAGLVSYTVCSSSQIFMSMFITGASQTMIPIVGVCLGEKDFDGVKYAFMKAFKILTIASIVITLFI
ncbi:MAG: MATE family efflux transporter [Ruminococcus sp.]|nr:MATE family efflux transporter [Ruminococcus sp.]MDD5889592.1 MATE family efflux transporter [Ruminococcus sp.]